LDSNEAILYRIKSISELIIHRDRSIFAIVLIYGCNIHLFKNLGKIMFQEGSGRATDGGFTKLVGSFPYSPPEGVQKGGGQMMTGGQCNHNKQTCLDHVYPPVSPAAESRCYSKLRIPERNLRILESHIKSSLSVSSNGNKKGRHK
jgi:hypothetical protein